MNSQRKGQWLYNKLIEDCKERFETPIDTLHSQMIQSNINDFLTRKLWNMTNVEFDQLMLQYDAN